MSPGSVAVTRPSALIVATWSLLLVKRQRQVTSSRVPSGQTATALRLHLLARLAEQDLGRRHFQVDELLHVLLVELRAAFEPAAEDVVFPAALLVALAAFVHVGVGRLDEDQAFQRLVLVGPLRLALQQLVVVGLEVVAEQRQAEAAAALKAAVAAAAVAAQAAEQRADVPLKARLFGHVAVGKPLG